MLDISIQMGLRVTSSSLPGMRYYLHIPVEGDHPFQSKATFLASSAVPRGGRDASTETEHEEDPRDFAFAVGV
jgi:hypothetical protein